MSLKAIKDEEVEGKPVKFEDLRALDATTWPGINMTEYQFPPKDHPAHSRAAVTSWIEMLGLTREHGVKFKRQTSGRYTNSSCSKCDGMMSVHWPAGEGMCSTVKSSMPCKCALKSGSDVECDNLDSLYGHTLLRIAAEDDFVQAFWRTSVVELLTKQINKKRKSGNNGTYSYATFATKGRKLWELKTNKNPLNPEGGEPFTFQVHSLVSHNIDDLLDSDEKEESDENEKEKCAKAENNNNDTEAELAIGAPGQCLCCSSEAFTVELVCSICQKKESGKAPQLCYPCFNKMSATRRKKPIDLNDFDADLFLNNFATDFVLIHKEDGFPCPLDKCRVIQARHNNNPVSTGIHHPYAWIGERPERNRLSHAETMKTFNFVVHPFVHAYAEVKKYELQAEEVQKAYLTTKPQMIRDTSAAYVEQEDAKYESWFKSLRDAMRYHHSKVGKFKWLRGTVTAAGEPPPVPEADMELAKKGVPIDAAGSYPERASLREVMADIDKTVAIFNGATGPTPTDEMIVITSSSP